MTELLTYQIEYVIFLMMTIHLIQVSDCRTLTANKWHVEHSNSLCTNSKHGRDLRITMFLVWKYMNDGNKMRECNIPRDLSNTRIRNWSSDLQQMTKRTASVEHSAEY